MAKLGNLTIENAKVIFRNFAGNGDKFNTPGNRNFCVLLEDAELVEDLKRDGWNVKQLKPRNEEDEPAHYIQVKVAYDNFPPKIFLVTGRSKTLMNESTIATLDFAEIINVDLIVSPYEWEVNGKTGIKAYAKTMYITIAEDEFASKYDFDDDIPEMVPFN